MLTIRFATADAVKLSLLPDPEHYCLIDTSPQQAVGARQSASLLPGGAGLDADQDGVGVATEWQGERLFQVGVVPSFGDGAEAGVTRTVAQHRLLSWNVVVTDDHTAHAFDQYLVRAGAQLADVFGQVQDRVHSAIGNIRAVVANVVWAERLSHVTLEQSGEAGISRLHEAFQ